jgi:hypothetical protein
MNKIHVLFSLLISLTIPSFAQDTTFNSENSTLGKSPNTVDQELITENELFGDRFHMTSNFAEITQDGRRQIAEIIQKSQTGPSGANLASITQTGDENNASINQAGEGNTSIIKQRGENNSGTQKTYGDYNFSFLEQLGYDNKCLQVISGDNISNIVIQRGYDNQMQRVETGQGGLGYRIIQDGNGMSLTVINGH